MVGIYQFGILDGHVRLKPEWFSLLELVEYTNMVFWVGAGDGGMLVVG